MARIDSVSREQLSAEDQQYYDAIVGTRGSVRGPFGVLLNSPKLAARVADTGAFVRFEFGQPEALKETLIIATAKEMEQQYEFSAHARLAREAGVSDATIAAIANGTAPAGLEGDEAPAGQLRPRVAAPAQGQRRDFQGNDQPFRRERHPALHRAMRPLPAGGPGADGVRRGVGGGDGQGDTGLAGRRI